MATLHDAIVFAVAQAWCRPQLGDRVMDAELAYAIVENVEAVIERMDPLVLQRWVTEPVTS